MIKPLRFLFIFIVYAFLPDLVQGYPLKSDTVATAVEVIYAAETRPENGLKLGEVDFSSLTSKNCSIIELLDFAKKSALDKGGDAVYVTVLKSTSRGFGCYQIKADIYKLQDPYTSYLNPDADLKSTTTYTEGFALTETMPSYPGGFDEMTGFFDRNFTMPKSAKKSKVSGLLVVTFTVNETGKMKEIQVIKGLSPDLDKEAIRVFSLMPEWVPGFQNGKATYVKYTYPIKINFK